MRSELQTRQPENLASETSGIHSNGYDSTVARGGRRQTKCAGDFSLMAIGQPRPTLLRFLITMPV